MRGWRFFLAMRPAGCLLVVVFGGDQTVGLRQWVLGGAWCCRQWQQGLEFVWALIVGLVPYYLDFQGSRVFQLRSIYFNCFIWTFWPLGVWTLSPLGVVTLVDILPIKHLGLGLDFRSLLVLLIFVTISKVNKIPFSSFKKKGSKHLTGCHAFTRPTPHLSLRWDVAD